MYQYTIIIQDGNPIAAKSIFASSKSEAILRFRKLYKRYRYHYLNVIRINKAK